MKKLTAVCLALIMLLGLVSCAGPAANDSNSSGNAADSGDSNAANTGNSNIAENTNTSNGSGNTDTGNTSNTVPPVIPDEDLSFTEEEWPIVDGATAFLPFYTAVSAQLLGKTRDEAAQYILCSTTDYAYPDLIDGKADIIFCFGPSTDQKNMAKGKGVEFEYTPILNEAFVFFVNKDNPVSNITIQQLHDIYAGKITNWKELGGNDEEIIPYQRSEGSGSQTGLYQYVISEDEVMDPPIGGRIPSMAGVIDVVASYDNAKGGIGYSYLYFVKNQHYDENIKLLNVEGIQPSTDAIASGTYPMINTAYAIILNIQPEDSPARKIAAWCRTDKARQFSEELGYVFYKDQSGK